MIVINDGKTNLGPGYYQNEDDIKYFKKRYKDMVKTGRRNVSKSNLAFHSNSNGFSSSTAREEGSLLKTLTNQKSYKGTLGQYYNSNESSVIKKSFNAKYQSTSKKRYMRHSPF